MAIWINGMVAPQGEVDAACSGLSLGWGTFTTLCIRQGQPLLLPRHLARLRRAAALLGLPLVWSDDALTQGLAELVQANGLRAGLARMTLTGRGDGRWSQAPGTDLSILTHAGPALTATGQRLLTSSYRFPAQSPLAGLKTTSRLAYNLAGTQAVAAGYHDALLLNCREEVAESSRACVFWTSQGVIYTPALSTGCLEGVGRDLLKEWIQKDGDALMEVAAPVEALLQADECILISGATGPRQVQLLHYSGQDKEFTDGAVFNKWRDRWDALES